MRLPVYNNSSMVTAEPQTPRTDYSGIADAVKQGFDAYNRWQEIHDAADELDGKNKLAEKYKAIMTEANGFTGYETEKDIQAKQKELNKQLADVLPSIASSFGNSVLGKKFTDNHRLVEQEMQVRLDGIFRQKTLDNFMAAADQSYVTNMNSYIATGNDTYKKSFIDDMKNGFDVGLISKAELQRQINRTEAWNELYLTNAAEKDPNAFIKNIDEYNRRFKNVDAVKVAYRAAERAQRFQELEKAQNQSDNYLTLAHDLPAMNTADAILNIDNAEASEAISPQMAKTLRKRFVGKVDEDGKIKTDPAEYLDFSRKVIDVETFMGKDPSGLSLEGKETGIRSIDSLIDGITASGKLSDGDKRKLLESLYKARSKVGDALKVDDTGKVRLAWEFTNADAYDYLTKLTKGDPNLRGLVEERAEIWREYTDIVAKAKPGVLDGSQLKPLMEQLVAKYTAQAFRRWERTDGQSFSDKVNEELEKRKAK